MRIYIYAITQLLWSPPSPSSRSTRTSTVGCSTGTGGEIVKASIIVVGGVGEGGLVDARMLRGTRAAGVG